MAAKMIRFTPEPPEYLLIAVRMTSDAVEYLEAGDTLAKGERADAVRHFSPTMFLLCHSIELTMKGLLTYFQIDHRGRHNQHNLSNLVGLVDASGKYELAPSFKEAAQAMSAVHSSYQFRYFRPKGFSYFPAEKLVTMIEPQVRAMHKVVAGAAEDDYQASVRKAQGLDA